MLKVLTWGGLAATDAFAYLALAGWLGAGFTGQLMVIPATMAALFVQAIVIEGLSQKIGDRILTRKQGEIFLEEAEGVLFALARRHPLGHPEGGRIHITRGIIHLGPNPDSIPLFGYADLQARFREALELLSPQYFPVDTTSMVNNITHTFERPTPLSNHELLKVEGKHGALLDKVLPRKRP